MGKKRERDGKGDGTNEIRCKLGVEGNVCPVSPELQRASVVFL